MKAFVLATLLFAVTSPDLSGKSGPIPVTLEKSPEGYRLMRDNQPYFVKGAGAEDHLEQLASAGGNSVRTWGSEQTRELLETAHKNGLTVTAGLWIEHERHGFDYDDPEQVRAQIARHKAAVDEFKDHPALLMWGVGNEVWIEAENEKVWDTIEAVAAYIKEVDPAHPVMTVLPHVSAEEVAYIKSRCPSVDLLGFNSYGGIAKVGADARKFGWNGPFVIAEWGANGPWEVEKTAWGAEIEPTTTEKAKQRLDRYTYIREDPNCLGGYAFFWDRKQETTRTWFNLFLDDDSAVEGVDVLQYLWTGQFPVHRAPQISQVKLNGKRPEENVTTPPGGTLEATFSILGDDSGAFHTTWKCFRESADKRTGGDREQSPDLIPITYRRESPSKACFQAPEEPGAYRLFVFVTTPHGKAAAANIPFLVE